MSELPTILTLSVATLAGLAMLIAGSLAGWRGWLDLRRLELAERAAHLAPSPDAGAAPAGARIEIADLKERIRKLEAIAAGIDL